MANLSEERCGAGHRSKSGSDQSLNFYLTHHCSLSDGQKGRHHYWNGSKGIERFKICSRWTWWSGMARSTLAHETRDQQNSKLLCHGSIGMCVLWSVTDSVTEQPWHRAHLLKGFILDDISATAVNTELVQTCNYGKVFFCFLNRQKVPPCRPYSHFWWREIGKTKKRVCNSGLVSVLLFLTSIDD